MNESTTARMNYGYRATAKPAETSSSRRQNTSANQTSTRGHCPRCTTTAVQVHYGVRGCVACGHEMSNVADEAEQMFWEYRRNGGRGPRGDAR